jgi:hypothetical protein
MARVILSFLPNQRHVLSISYFGYVISVRKDNQIRDLTLPYLLTINSEGSQKEPRQEKQQSSQINKLGLKG